MWRFTSSSASDGVSGVARVLIVGGHLGGGTPTWGGGHTCSSKGYVEKGYL